ncbi:KAT8 regulatory NSL complex subunit 1-like protein isoform X2 [Melanotaenia boesemani]|uniref:KAT8 regulatory NSL complex subunit 1-like protein isoform X2 n=1 Tax=Melanotaenia boesemani TaxID=1250792 RepID=UPI001C04A1FF|nr:KAT8 regulatory NSL complex subunit 1-like protein isoform X2 [Melanotaenia boesemani]
MAPALTKILKNGHGIHLSSPPASATIDSNGRAMCATELDPHMRSTDDGDLQNIWLNLCSFRALDPCFPSCAPDASVNPGLSSCVETSASQCEMVPLSSPGSLVRFLSFNKCHRDSQQVSTVFPGVSDMFLIPVPEHNSQGACLMHGQSAVPEYGPDGADVHHSYFNLAGPPYSHGDIRFWSDTQLLATQPTIKYEEVTRMACPPLPSCHPSSVQPGIGMVNRDHQGSNTVLEEAVKEQLSRQAGLEGRAWRLQRRLKALLGEHALLHCSQQLEGLKNHCQLGDVSHDHLESIHYGLASPQACTNPQFSWQELSRASPFFTEVREFSYSSQKLLKGLQEDLDSEATGSSSSDEESEEDKIYGKISPVSNCEKQWLEERAELSSRWSWLQLRLAELEGRIQELVKLHRHLCSTKGGVVLAESQPLTDRQIQHTLMREMAGLSCTAADTDTEPWSPTHLLHNIQRQSAQLNQIVNSLMPPLSFSPLSKQTQTSKGRRALTSCQSGDDVFVSGSSKRKKLWTRRLFKADVSCVCARARPLITYHKRKLFTFNNDNPACALKSRKSMSAFSSSLSSTSCSCGSSCDPVALCSDPDCSSSSILLSSASSSRPHSVTPLSSGRGNNSSTCHSLQRVVAREEWSQRPLTSSQLSSPANYKRNSSTPQHNSYKFKPHARHHKNRVMGLSPIRSSYSTRGRCSRSSQRKRRRRRIHRLTEDNENVLYQLFDSRESSDDMLEESYTPVTHNQSSQGFVRKRQGDGVYNINDIVIPMFHSKVEKLLYKGILTPSWRLVDVQSSVETKAEEEEESQIEALGDEVFAQRHMTLEHKEKLRWSIWEKRKRYRRPTRSGSRLSGSVGGMCTSGEESSVEWSWAQLDADEQPQSEERPPQAPWEPRVFPLDESEEASLLSAEEGRVSSGWTESSSASHSSKSPNSRISPTQSACAALPSHGQSESGS